MLCTNANTGSKEEQKNNIVFGKSWMESNNMFGQCSQAVYLYNYAIKNMTIMKNLAKNRMICVSSMFINA